MYNNCRGRRSEATRAQWMTTQCVVRTRAWPNRSRSSTPHSHADVTLWPSRTVEDACPYRWIIQSIRRGAFYMRPFLFVHYSRADIESAPTDRESSIICRGRRPRRPIFVLWILHQFRSIYIQIVGTGVPDGPGLSQANFGTIRTYIICQLFLLFSHANITFHIQSNPFFQNSLTNFARYIIILL